jgi:hypothetical protein
MPHVHEFTASHEQHDPLLMAALAAGDLAGPERDRALDVSRSCAECAALHDDLVAIARATADVPPPIAMPARDFRLSPDQAARLRPAGWRRFFGLAPRGALTRNLGVALATFGLAGLLIGTLPLAGSSASAPGGGPASPAAADQGLTSGAGGAAGGAAPEAAAPAASAPAASMAAASAAASSAPLPLASSPAASADRTALGPADGSASGPPDVQGEFGTETAAASDHPNTVGAAGVGSPKATEQTTQIQAEPSTRDQASTTGSWSPLVIVSAIAIVLGAALFVLGRRREREPA